jgi:hypothetical protein
MWCIQEITEEYRTRMYRLLDLYKQAYDPSQPMVCMDEKSKQLLEDNRQPIKAKPGKPEKFDYEYKRKETCNIFVAVVPKAGIRIVKVQIKEQRKILLTLLKNWLRSIFVKQHTFN